MSSLKRALSIIKEKANNDTEMGLAFEKLAKVFFENDSTQIQQYSQVWHFSEWAKERKEYSKSDIGIDLVAKLREEDGYCAIQCKFYQHDHAISKADLDSFISASSTSDFARLVLIDTSSQPISKNAQLVFDNLTKDYVRIQLNEIEESRIDWTTYLDDGSINLSAKKELKDHQIKAFNSVLEGLEKEDRGKMIMACGTGKTFTSLRIAEQLAGEGKMVLYMVPSLALMSQTVREWKNDSNNEFLAFSVCSDQKVGKKKQSKDQIQISMNELAFPATTDAKKLSEKIKRAEKLKMKVVFATYHSIEVISKSQYEFGLDTFDLIICDEAHRTTGATLVGEDESNFVRIHNDEYIRGGKRLYMTATPRIYGETAKRREDEGEVSLASMDNEKIFGKNLFYHSFGWAVENNLLTDYKVVVLMMDEQLVSDRVQRSFSEGAELELDDATKMVGCYKALAKIGIKTNIEGVSEDNQPMKRALAFCQNIRTSEMFSSEFSSVVNDYISNEKVSEINKTDLKVELFHVDGTFNAEQRNEKLSWLKEDTDKNTCRVLSNARCLSEGVDVPALDAIMFLHPRRSQIDVVQSVGRVMRKAKGKKLGYVILPITVAPGVTAEKALNENDRYQVVWQILNALRAHDERFDSTINKIGLGEDVSDRIEIIDGTSSSELEATTSVIEDVRPRSRRDDNNEDHNDTNLGEETEGENNTNTETEQLSFTLTDLSQAIKAKIVEKCGTRDYWEKWAGDIAIIAQKHITRINSIVLNSGTRERDSFIKFLEEMRDDLNPEITETDAVEMLAQHIITRPVFDTLFQGNRFTSENAVSKAMETVLSQIYENQIDTETRTLKRFYESVKMRAADISTARGRQQLIYELYDRFFRNAFPLMTKKLGIVYTPVEVVDFIIHSVETIMQDEFGSSLSDEGVHILDPFSGTGTFISRLLQSNIIPKEQIKRKFKSEIHANEIVLLAYYIACINIEAVYDDLIKENEYQSFDGMVLTDTFQLYEQDRDMIANLLPDNSERRTKQKSRNITIIMGNPPYSAGQKSENDNAANVRYENLDKAISDTYAKYSNSTRLVGIYDSYIRAIKWATERIGNKGCIAFVCGNAWLDRNFADGMRKSLTIDFSQINIINLRGDIRKNMLSSGLAKEGENIFEEGSMTGICIVILVKNKDHNGECKINYFDIGDDKTSKQKLQTLSSLGSLKKIKKDDLFQKIVPNKYSEWLNQGNEKFSKYILLGDSRPSEEVIFQITTSGVVTNRDAWCYNFSKEKLTENIKNLINNYNNEISKIKPGTSQPQVKELVNKNPKDINWSRNLFKSAAKREKLNFNEESIRLACYRPFTKTNLYFNKSLNEVQYKVPQIFPKQDSKNLFIGVSGVGARSGFSCLMSDTLPDLQFLDNSLIFAQFSYSSETGELSLFESVGKTSNISRSILQKFQTSYENSEITEENIFYYVYALLHSKDYKLKFSNNLLKQTPRIPIPKSFDSFNFYANAGKELGELHVGFENAEKYPVSFKEGNLLFPTIENPKEFYAVKKMKFLKKGDFSTVIYNKNLTLEGIPKEAFDYIVFGKPALQWIMERQCVKTDNASGITNDANDYANETMSNPAYPLELFQRIITVSLETIRIVKSLPILDLD